MGIESLILEFYNWNQVYETRDAILQFSSNRMLTYDILSPRYASLQIPSKMREERYDQLTKHKILMLVSE